jgi:hypothetical protein
VYKYSNGARVSTVTLVAGQKRKQTDDVEAMSLPEDESTTSMSSKAANTATSATTRALAVTSKLRQAVEDYRRAARSYHVAKRLRRSRSRDNLMASDMASAGSRMDMNTSAWGGAGLSRAAAQHARMRTTLSDSERERDAFERRLPLTLSMWSPGAGPPAVPKEMVRRWNSSATRDTTSVTPVWGITAPKRTHVSAAAAADYFARPPPTAHDDAAAAATLPGRFNPLAVYANKMQSLVGNKRKDD